MPRILRSYGHPLSSVMIENPSSSLCYRTRPSLSTIFSFFHFFWFCCQQTKHIPIGRGNKQVRICMLVKKLNSYLRPVMKVFKFFSRCLLSKEFFQAFLVTEVVLSSSNSFPNRSSLLDIGLTIGILNKFFRFRFRPPIQFFPLFEYPIHQAVKDRIKKEKKKDE